jgi:diguanylate cyclase (GGDEF)-like protein
MIDIDNFKQFNDRHGHDAGDFVLSALARAIARNIRPSDLACRYGGEEFAVVLPEASVEIACQRAEEMRQAIRNTNLMHLGQTLAAPSASLGIAMHPGDGVNAPDLLKAADRALYRAKHEGRDRVSLEQGAARAPARAPEA